VKIKINENKQTNQTNKIFFYFLGPTRIDLGPTYFCKGKSKL